MECDDREDSIMASVPKMTLKQVKYCDGTFVCAHR